MIWVIWAFLLIFQNASFTLVSRARNSDNIWYHAWAATLSNGVWFLSNLILVDNVLKILQGASWAYAVGVAVFYTICTLTGALSMHWLAINRIERRAA